jgi:predicted transcriptional regulator
MKKCVDTSIGQCYYRAMRRDGEQTSRVKISRKFYQATLPTSELGKVLSGNDQLVDKSKVEIKPIETITFDSLSELLKFCNITPREFANKTKFSYKAVLQWTKGYPINEPNRDEILSITVRRSPRINGYWERITLHGAKVFFNYNGEKLELNRETGLIANKPRNLSLQIINNFDWAMEDSFLKE